MNMQEITYRVCRCLERGISRQLEESYLESVPWSVVGQEPSFVEKGYT